VIRRRSVALLVAALAAAGAGRAADYYVSPGGDDGGPGSQLQPWGTTARVNAEDFLAGDRILFAGGESFAGGLLFDDADAGTAAGPIVLTSYGTGRATIRPAARGSPSRRSTSPGRAATRARRAASPSTRTFGGT
jgi:hypothetical protein